LLLWAVKVQAQFCTTPHWKALPLNYSTYKSDTVMYVQVVVHQLYSASAPMLSMQSIANQLQSLNADFNREHDDTVNTLSTFLPLAGKSRIRFVLANKDSNGNTFSGVVYKFTTKPYFADNSVFYDSLGGSAAWSPSKYLNIWVCTLPSGTAGYASTPAQATTKEDGIVIDYRFFYGNAQSRGRTLTHEAGHWLGLLHLWGAAGNCNDDDGMDDTPKQESASSGCNLTRVSCGQLNMVQNFMDYSDETCLNIFTQQQCNRMRNVLLTYRKSVVDYAAQVRASVNEENRLPLIQVFYQRTQNAIVVSGVKHEIKIQLYDMNGKELLLTKTQQDTIIDISDYKKGIILIMLADDKHAIHKRIFLAD
jgi:hypothetical protein